MPLNLKTASGGSVIITGANTATDKTITVPAADTTMVGTDSTQTLSNKTFSGAQTFGTASFAEPSGSAPLYAARAWVNFNGTGTVAIRASGNVSSITDNGTGDYTVNITTAISDANYAVVTSTGDTANIGTTSGARAFSPMTLTTTTCRVLKTSAAGVALDENLCMVAIFR